MIWLIGYILIGVIVTGAWLGTMDESDRCDILNDGFVFPLPLIWPLIVTFFGTCAVAGLVSGFISAIKTHKDELTVNGKLED